MNKDQKLLLFIYQNAKVGRSTLEEVLPTLESKRLITVIKKQIKNYNDIIIVCNKYLIKNNDIIEETQLIPRISTYTGVKSNYQNNNQLTMALMQSTHLGSLDLEKILKEDYSKQSIKDLGDRLLKCEKGFVKKLNNI